MKVVSRRVYCEDCIMEGCIVKAVSKKLYLELFYFHFIYVSHNKLIMGK